MDRGFPSTRDGFFSQRHRMRPSSQGWRPFSFPARHHSLRWFPEEAFHEHSNGAFSESAIKMVAPSTKAAACHITTPHDDLGHFSTGQMLTDRQLRVAGQAPPVPTVVSVSWYMNCTEPSRLRRNEICITKPLPKSRARADLSERFCACCSSAYRCDVTFPLCIQLKDACVNPQALLIGPEVGCGSGTFNHRSLISRLIDGGVSLD